MRDLPTDTEEAPDVDFVKGRQPPRRTDYRWRKAARKALPPKDDHST